MKTEEVLDLFADAYRGEPFVRIRPKGKLPSTRDVRVSNYCDIGVVSGGDGRMVIVTAIDNLVKALPTGHPEYEPHALLP
jgi:N-acetyl-gamma-glutamyl-phosphate reductase